MSYDTVVAADSPVNWWKMGDTVGSSTAADSGSGGTSLTMSGTVTFGQTGIPGSTATAVLFASSKGVQSGSTYAAPTTLSIEYWVKTTMAGVATTGSGASGAPIETFGTNSTFDRQTGVDPAGKLMAYSFPNSYTGLGVINDGNWHHVVMTITSGNVGKVYLDSVLVLSNTLTLNSFSDVWDIGRAFSGLNFVGTVAHVAYYNAILSATQVTNHYNAGNPPSYVPLAFRGSFVPQIRASHWRERLSGLLTTGHTFPDIRLAGA